MPAPAPLPENLPFAFRGECLDAPRLVTAADARRLRAARNATGKPNADVLRDFLGVAPDRTERRRTAIDFPPEMSEPETRLYVAPFAALARAGAALHAPRRDADLRNALARLDRFLAAPAAEQEPAFAWVEGEVLPDDSLVVWARDDDFSAGILMSRAFALWCEPSGDLLAALGSYPFPWPPATPLSALSRAQEETRFALARAARNEDASAIDTAVASTYGWPADLRDAEILTRLASLHATRR